MPISCCSLRPGPCCLLPCALKDVTGGIEVPVDIAVSGRLTTCLVVGHDDVTDAAHVAGPPGSSEGISDRW